MKNGSKGFFKAIDRVGTTCKGMFIDELIEFGENKKYRAHCVSCKKEKLIWASEIGSKKNNKCRCWTCDQPRVPYCAKETTPYYRLFHNVSSHGKSTDFTTFEIFYAWAKELLGNVVPDEKAKLLKIDSTKPHNFNNTTIRVNTKNGFIDYAVQDIEANTA